MAERFGSRPSLLLGISPDEDWFAYCVDEALHTLQAGHTARDERWHERWRREPGEDGEDLYEKAMRDPRAGRPPSRADLDALRYAAETSGMMSRDE